MPSPRQSVQSLAAELGAEVEQSPQGVSVLAPQGSCWRSGGVLELVAERWDDGAPMASLWQDVLSRMREGLIPELPIHREHD